MTFAYLILANLLYYVIAKFVKKKFKHKKKKKKKNCRCGGSLVARQTSVAEVPGSNLASTTMILMRCRIIV